MSSLKDPHMRFWESRHALAESIDYVFTEYATRAELPI
jgi:hypothetical protein